MRTYNVAKHYRLADKALRRYQNHIAEASSEALVTEHVCHTGLQRCRELGEFLHGLMVDLRLAVENCDIKEQAACRQTVLRAKAVARAIRYGKSQKRRRSQP